VFHRALSTLPQDVDVRPLSETLDDAPELALEVLGMDVSAPLFNGFTALNSAMASDGIGIRVKDGVCMDRPLYVLHVASDRGLVAHIRHGIMLGRASRATVIEHFAGSATAAGVSNAVTCIRLGKDARLDHYKLQQEGEHAFHVGRIQCRQAEGSHFVSHSVSLGASLARTDIHVRLSGEGASCTLGGLYMTGGRQHADHHTRIDHLSPACTSEEYYRGVLSGRSHAVFNGKVVVHEGADATDARQSNDNLLLSRHAEVDTKPELEIYADDVKCAHGATVGQLDADSLFYLRSRGVDEETARNLLIHAFAGDVIRRFSLPEVRKSVAHAMLARLPAGAAAGDLL